MANQRAETQIGCDHLDTARWIFKNPVPGEHRTADAGSDLAVNDGSLTMQIGERGADAGYKDQENEVLATSGCSHGLVLLSLVYHRYC